MDKVAATLEQLIDVGWNARAFSHYAGWTARVKAFLRQALGDDVAAEFMRTAHVDDPEEWEHRRDELTGMLEGIIAVRAELEPTLDAVGAAPAGGQACRYQNGYFSCTAMITEARKRLHATSRSWA